MAVACPIRNRKSGLSSLLITTTVCSSTTPTRSIEANVRLSLLVLFSPAARSKRELDRVGIEGLAVLEFDALAQLEGVGLEVGRDFPALGQQRRDAAVGVDLGEGLEDVVLTISAIAEAAPAVGSSPVGSSVMPRTTASLRFWASEASGRVAREAAATELIAKSRRFMDGSPVNGRILAMK
jgi:hypothetical protein